MMPEAGMRWPGLVPRALCKTPIQVTLRREGMDEDGAPVAALTVETVAGKAFAAFYKRKSGV